MPFFYGLGGILFAVLIFLLLIEFLFLFLLRNELDAYRVVADKLSNGDRNQVFIKVKGKFSSKVNLRLIEELPDQIQLTNQEFRLKAKKLLIEETVRYFIRPIERGEYHFGNIRIGVKSRIGMVERFYTFAASQTVKVYPSMIQYQKFSLLNSANRLNEAGVKRMRKVGGASEFDQIKEYHRGDDFKRINWKATARKRQLMVNHFEDEKAQAVYLVIDKGRMMHMPFEGLSLLDYSINSALVLAGIAQSRGDKAGLITFSNVIGSWIPPSRKRKQIGLINEALYKQETRVKESDYQRLLLNLRTQVKGRSLIILYTNFESRLSMQRQMKYLQAIAKKHLLLCVIFENTELRQRAKKAVYNLDGFFEQSVSEGLILEKEQVLTELKRNGIQAIKTSPNDLSVNTINKYLEIKNRGLL